jgi:hypothetical protein
VSSYYRKTLQAFNKGNQTMKRTLATVPFLPARDVFPLLEDLPDPTTPSGMALESILSDFDSGAALWLATVAQGFSTRLEGFSADHVRTLAYFRFLRTAHKLDTFPAFDEPAHAYLKACKGIATWHQWIRSWGIPS